MCKYTSCLNNIQAVILAGGKGTRLHHITSNKPKILAKVQGRAFITFILDQLEHFGVQKVILCTGYKGELVQEKLGDFYNSIKIVYSEEKELLDTGGALRLALPKLKSDEVIVMNGDSYIDVDLSDFTEWYLTKEAVAALLLTKVQDTRQYGKVLLDRSLKIKGFEEKGEKRSSGWINAGVYIMKKKIIDIIPEGKPYSLELDFFPQLVENSLYGYRFLAPFIDIGTPESYSRADSFFSKI